MISSEENSSSLLADFVPVASSERSTGTARGNISRRSFDFFGEGTIKYATRGSEMKFSSPIFAGERFGDEIGDSAGKNDLNSFSIFPSRRGPLVSSQVELCRIIHCWTSLVSALIFAPYAELWNLS